MWYDLSIVCHCKSNRFSPATYLCLGTVVPWWHGSWIYKYLCNQCLSPLMLWVGMSIRTRCTTLCDKVCLWLARGRWFSLGPPVSTSTKSDCHDIANILLKVALNTTKQSQIQTICACSKPGVGFSTSQVMGFSILFWFFSWYGLNFKKITA